MQMGPSDEAVEALARARCERGFSVLWADVDSGLQSRMRESARADLAAAWPFIEAALQRPAQDGGGGRYEWYDDPSDTSESAPRVVAAVHEEWRVTGQPAGGFPAYDFTFGNPAGCDLDPRQAALDFIRLTVAGTGWLDGPFLQSRVVVETAWLDCQLRCPGMASTAAEVPAESQPAGLF